MPKHTEVRPYRRRSLLERDYVPADPDQSFWDRPIQMNRFVDETQADIDAELRDFERCWRAGIIAGLIVVAFLWWLQS